MKAILFIPEDSNQSEWMRSNDDGLVIEVEDPRLLSILEDSLIPNLDDADDEEGTLIDIIPPVWRLRLIGKLRKMRSEGLYSEPE